MWYNLLQPNRVAVAGAMEITMEKIWKFDWIRSNSWTWQFCQRKTKENKSHCCLPPIQFFSPPAAIRTQLLRDCLLWCTSELLQEVKRYPLKLVLEILRKVLLKLGPFTQLLATPVLRSWFVLRKEEKEKKDTELQHIHKSKGVNKSH